MVGFIQEIRRRANKLMANQGGEVLSELSETGDLLPSDHITLRFQCSYNRIFLMAVYSEEDLAELAEKAIEQQKKGQGVQG